MSFSLRKIFLGDRKPGFLKRLPGFTWIISALSSGWVVRVCAEEVVKEPSEKGFYAAVGAVVISFIGMLTAMVNAWSKRYGRSLPRGGEGTTGTQSMDGLVLRLQQTFVTKAEFDRVARDLHGRITRESHEMRVERERADQAIQEQIRELAQDTTDRIHKMSRDCIDAVNESYDRVVATVGARDEALVKEVSAAAGKAAWEAAKKIPIPDGPAR